MKQARVCATAGLVAKGAVTTVAVTAVAVTAVAALALLFHSAPANAGAVVIHTGPFLAAPTHVNGFELMADGMSHTEQGIAVSYVGRATGIWRTSQLADGAQSWYPEAGGFGFTRITLANSVSAFQFSAGSGWLIGDPGLQFRLMAGGSIVAEGVIEGLPRYRGFRSYGFSGLEFDELHLQSLLGPSPFDELGFDALALDSLAHGGEFLSPQIPIPEPQTWTMLILGFGLMGLALRRQKNAVRHDPSSRSLHKIETCTSCLVPASLDLTASDRPLHLLVFPHGFPHGFPMSVIPPDRNMP